MRARIARLLTDVFPDLPTPAVDELCAMARLAEHPAQVSLCREGEVEHSFFIIVEGRVDVYRFLGGQRLLINQLVAGDHFGELSLLLDQARTATIITSEPTQVLEVDREIFGRLIKMNSQAVVALSRLVLKRFLVQEEKQLVEIARLKRRDTPPPKIFVSYSRADQPFVTRLANNLLKQHIDVWLDVFRLEPGRSWARQIGEALDVCQIMLVVLSPTSAVSENVDDEWNYYLDQKKPILVVRYQPCKVPYRLSKLHYIDFHETDYEQALAHVVATLNTLE